MIGRLEGGIATREAVLVATVRTQFGKVYGGDFENVLAQAPGHGDEGPARGRVPGSGVGGGHRGEPG